MNDARIKQREQFVKVTQSAGSDLQLKLKKKQCLGVTDLHLGEISWAKKDYFIQYCQ